MHQIDGLVDQVVFDRGSEQVEEWVETSISAMHRKKEHHEINFETVLHEATSVNPDNHFPGPYQGDADRRYGEH